MSTIYMIRHGQASFGGDTYDRLSDLGVRQAKIVAADLVKKDRRFDAIYYGTLERQRKTADAFMEICREKMIDVPDPIEDKAFNEYDSESVVSNQFPLMLEGDPTLAEMMERIQTDKRAFQLIFEKAMQRWASGNFDPPGVPTWAGFKADVTTGLSALMERFGAKKTIAVFTSGGPVSVAVQFALGLSDAKAMEISWQIMNASVTRFKYNRSNIALAGFNDIGHLELENKGALLTYR